MSIENPISSTNRLPAQGETFSENHNHNVIWLPRTDEYILKHVIGTDTSGDVDIAKKIHALGYAAKEFVKPEAINQETGQLDDTVDGSHADMLARYTDYTIGYKKQNPTDAALTIHTIMLPPERPLTDFPAYQISADSLSAEGKQLLEDRVGSIVELGGMARTAAEVDGRGIYEAIRDNFHSHLGQDKTWFFSIVKGTFKSLVHEWGEQSMTQIGEPFKLDNPLVDERTRLVPAILEVDSLLRNIHQAAAEALDPEARDRYLASFLFFCDGLQDEQLGDEELIQTRRILQTMIPDLTTKYGHWR